jgi:uncharacterized protein
MLTLHLRTIRTPREHFEQVYQPSALAAGAEVSGAADDEFKIVAPVSLSFDVQKGGIEKTDIDKSDIKRSNEQYRLVGRVGTTVALTCSRCLESFELLVDAPFDLRYRPLHAHPGGGEREVEEDDFSTALYENDEIDLGQLIRERLYLAVPMKPLCEAGCRGLCAECGTNLNHGRCSCRRAWEDPRLAALRAMKKDS